MSCSFTQGHALQSLRLTHTARRRGLQSNGSQKSSSARNVGQGGHEGRVGAGSAREQHYHRRHEHQWLDP